MRAGPSVAALSALVALSGVALAKPRHEGFTGDLGLGLGLTSVPVTTYTSSCSSGGGCLDTVDETRESHGGLAPLSLSLGGFVSPNLALLARVAGTSYFEHEDAYGNSFFGPVLEAWPQSAYYLSAGIGFASFGPNPLFSDSPVDPESGWALDFRVGAALAQGTNHDFTLSLEVIPGFYDPGTVVGVALVGAWKWY